MYYIMPGVSGRSTHLPNLTDEFVEINTRFPRPPESNVAPVLIQSRTFN